jgi:hypothetical protein
VTEPAFTPELGQFAFSNTPWQPVDGDMYVRGLSLLGELATPLLGGNPTHNEGSDAYESSVFQIRTYCWCDGERPGHEDGCPPNFVHLTSGLQVTWYKYAGRGTSANRILSPADWAQVMAECLTDLTASLRAAPAEAA